MNNVNSLIEWQPYQLIGIGLMVIVVNLALGFSLWKALSNSGWTPFFNISFLLTAFGATMLAITMSRVVVVDFLVNFSAIVLVSGVLMTLFGAIYDVAHRINLYRDSHHHKEA